MIDATVSVIITVTYCINLDTNIDECMTSHCIDSQFISADQSLLTAQKTQVLITMSATLHLVRFDTFRTVIAVHERQPGRDMRMRRK